jgi:pyridoxamine 5'-phosphate oxidase
MSFFFRERQVIIKGAQRTSEIISDNYNSRPEGSKLGAIVSNQSEVVPSHIWKNLKQVRIMIVL